MQAGGIPGTVQVRVMVARDVAPPVPGVGLAAASDARPSVSAAGQPAHMSSGAPQAGRWMQLLQERRPRAEGAQPMEITPAAQASGEALAAAGGFSDERIVAMVSPIMDAESRKMSDFELEVARARMGNAARGEGPVEVHLTVPLKLLAADLRLGELAKAVRAEPETVGEFAVKGLQFGAAVHPLMLCGVLIAGGGGMLSSNVKVIFGLIVLGIGFLLGGFLTMGIGGLVGAIVGAVKKAKYNHDKKHLEQVDAKAGAVNS